MNFFFLIFITSILENVVFFLFLGNLNVLYNAMGHGEEKFVWGTFTDFFFRFVNYLGYDLT